MITTALTPLARVTGGGYPLFLDNALLASALPGLEGGTLIGRFAP